MMVVAFGPVRHQFKMLDARHKKLCILIYDIIFNDVQKI